MKTILTPSNSKLFVTTLFVGGFLLSAVSSQSAYAQGVNPGMNDTVYSTPAATTAHTFGGNGAPAVGDNAAPPVGNNAAPPIGNNSAPGLTNPLNAPDLQTLLAEVLGYAVQIGSLFLSLMLIYVGFLFVAARGNEEKLQNAKAALLWTVVGGLLLLGASAIGAAIGATAKSL